MKIDDILFAMFYGRFSYEDSFNNTKFVRSFNKFLKESII
jgi:hypothetical protein